ncbi:MAG: hypothetical protein A2010_05270 [Nitrospirae bacterium GWD2_57_9]|nr:MAG: hypothetical protein A2010_05270 [Nitrospirae bacterium GWD2_57_9]
MTAEFMPVTTPGDCTLVALQEADERAWDHLIGTLDGNFKHSFAWSRWSEKRSGPPAYFTIEKAGQPVAAGWYLVSSPALSGRRIKQALFETLPCFDRQRISASEVFAEVMSLARREKWIAFSFGNSSPEYLTGAEACDVTEKISFRIDLSGSLKQIFSKFRDTHRKRIRRAEKGPLKFRILTDGQALAYAGALEELFQYTFERHVSRGKERERPAATSIGDGIRDLVLTGQAILFVALDGEEPVCFNLASSFPGKAQGMFLASSARGYELNASYLVMVRMIEYFRDRGYPYLDIGEVPRSAENEDDPDHGLYQYKTGYAADTALLCSGTVILRPGVNRVVTRLARGKTAIAHLLRLASGTLENPSVR